MGKVLVGQEDHGLSLFCFVLFPGSFCFVINAAKLSLCSEAVPQAWRSSGTERSLYWKRNDVTARPHCDTSLWLNSGKGKGRNTSQFSEERTWAWIKFLWSNKTLPNTVFRKTGPLLLPLIEECMETEWQILKSMPQLVGGSYSKAQGRELWDLSN